MQKTFLTICHFLDHVHLSKDVGMIPYLLNKQYNYRSFIACYNANNINVENIKLLKIKKICNNNLINELVFLFKEAKNIDILNIYAFSKESLVETLFYKLLRFLINKPGFVYLKLDANYKITKHKINSTRSIKYWFISKSLRMVDLITVESKELFEFLNLNWPVKVEYLPNGFYNSNQIGWNDVKKKDNLIITVGRIGTPEKATDILLEAFKLIYNKIPSYKLKIIGPVEKKFEPYIEKFFKENNFLKDRVIFTGNITDKQKLGEEYKKAKIFCLTSRWESFGIASVEALNYGCRVISSNISPAKDILNSGQFGDMFEIDNIKDLADNILKNCNNFILTEEYYKKSQIHIYNNFYWPKIINRLNELIENKIKI